MRVALVLGTVTCALLGAAEPALASTVSSPIGRVTVRYCTDMTIVAPNMSKPCWKVRARVPNGTQGTMTCWYDDPMPNGRLARWFYMTFGGAEGFVHSSSVPRNEQTPTPNCTSGSTQQRGPGVANFAFKHLYQISATSQDHQLLAQWGADWAGSASDGPYGEWAGDCLRFAWLAWAANGIQPLRAATAKIVGDQYASRLQGGIPPVGALVFYDGARGFGHVGISLGQGKVMSTTGFDGQGRPNLVYRLQRTGLPYRGWVFP